MRFVESHLHAAGQRDVILLQQDRIVEPDRWFVPPPIRTAYFSNIRNPGVVFRVSRIFAVVPTSCSTKPCVWVAIPLR